MLRPLPMKHVRLLVMTDDLPQASLTLAETESFHQDNRPPEAQRLAEAPGRDYRERYRQAAARLDKIAKVVHVPETPLIDQVHVVHPDELAAVSILLRERWDEASRFEESFRKLDDEERFIRDQEAALDNFANLKIDLGKLRSNTRFLDFYIGIVPRENVSRLQGAVQLADHLLFKYLERGDSAHVIIVGPRGEQEARLGSVLNSAGFQALPIPSDIADMDPARKHEELEARRAELAGQREALRTELAHWEQEHRQTLLDARRTLLLAEPFVNLDPSIRSSGHLAVLAGWVPMRSLPALAERLEQTLAMPFDLSFRDPRPDERALVPTVPVNNRWLTPFATLVKQYGIPQYGEVDPTPLFAFTFLLMFGSMFGDVGQGAVIAGVAYRFRDKLGRFWRFGVMAGVSSVFFGLLYGSIFGYEELLPALWKSPIHHPILMLKIALGYGVVFITVACALAIYNRFVVKNVAGAWFGHHGIVNLVFYLSLIWGGLNLAGGGAFGTMPTLLVVTSLGALAIYGWRHLSAPPGEKVLVVFIETLETIIGYVSNTLSFLRVAAFSLNHAALSLAVLTLADMMGLTGHILTVILGNLFVLVLEGGIVTIQVMRLEYYEGFSRYFSGEGHEFAPLRLRRGAETS
jgi:V/A-type H+-transporting ATPase subunit I